MDIRKIINYYSVRVRNKTTVLIKNLAMQLVNTKLDNVRDLENLLTDFVLSGKLIRGTLYLLITKMYGNKKIEDFLDIAVAIELNHSGLLIHDDIIDNDFLRRGKPTMHRRYSFLASDLGITDKEDLGKNMALCMGDICFFGSNLIIENSSIPKDIKQRITKYYFLQLLKTGLSQMLDVKLGLSTKDPKLSEIFKVYNYKTGSYTFNSPLIMGYYSSGNKDEAEIDILEKIGYSLGIIFQITDDLIGFLKDGKAIGKDAGSDIRENKKTIIRYFMLKQLKYSEYNFALKCFGNKRLSNVDLEKLREIYYTRQIDKIINKYLLDETIKAKANIKKLHLSDDYKTALIQFTENLVDRLI